MGGDLIASILSAHPHKLDSVNKLILAPNSNAQTLRRTLNFIGFSISYEEIVEEKGQFYEIIIAHNKPCHVCSIETKFGSYNLRNKSETFIKMWNDVYEQNKRLLNNENVPEVRRKEILEEQSLIENVIKRGEKT
jgi:tRNA (adenine22-N1)-methyltransferase